MTPLNEQAYNYLQKLIMENHFSYQEVYSETKLSKELGISRTPLRDAVHRLAQEGYIDIIPSKGFMLHQMNRKDVNETFQVRSALETYCTVQISKDASTRKAKKLHFHSAGAELGFYGGMGVIGIPRDLYQIAFFQLT